MKNIKLGGGGGAIVFMTSVSEKLKCPNFLPN